MKLTIEVSFSLQDLKEAITKYNGIAKPTKKDIAETISCLVEADIEDILFINDEPTQ